MASDPRAPGADCSANPVRDAITAPAVSVVLPVRDGERWVRRAVASLLAQTERAIEVLVVDDGSTDRTAAFVAAIARRDERVRLLQGPPAGIAPALARGVRAARAPLIARADVDDWSHPERLAAQRALLDARPDVDVVGCGVRSVPRRRVAEGYRRYDAWTNAILSPDAHRRTRFIESNVPHPTAMMRRAALERAGGYRDPPWPEDLDLWLRLHESGARFAKVDRILYLWRDRADRATRADPRYRRDAFIAARAHYLARTALLQRGTTIVWGTGPVGGRLSRALESHGVHTVAFVDVDPAAHGRTRRGAPVLAPACLDDARWAGVPVLAAVAARGARDSIREALSATGRVDERDFLVVA